MKTVKVLRHQQADTDYGIGHTVADGQRRPVVFADDLGEPGAYALEVPEGIGVECRYSGYRYWVHNGSWQEQHVSCPAPADVEFHRELDWSWAEEVRLND